MKTCKDKVAHKYTLYPTACNYRKKLSTYQKFIWTCKTELPLDSFTGSNAEIDFPSESTLSNEEKDLFNLHSSNSHATGLILFRDSNSRGT